MAKQTRKFTNEEKVSLVRRHLLEKEAVSDLCDALGLQPSQYYRWQKALFENGASAFDDKRTKKAHERRIAELETRLQAKNEVMAELMEEHVALKKKIGVR